MATVMNPPVEIHSDSKALHDSSEMDSLHVRDLYKLNALQKKKKRDKKLEKKKKKRSEKRRQLQMRRDAGLAEQLVSASVG